MIRLYFQEAINVVEPLGRKVDATHMITNDKSDARNGYTLTPTQHGWLITHERAAGGVVAKMGLEATFVPHNRCVVQGSESELRALYATPVPLDVAAAQEAVGAVLEQVKRKPGRPKKTETETPA